MNTPAPRPAPVIDRRAALRLVLYLVALLLGFVATAVGFGWLGITDKTEWEGWISASLTVLILAFVVER